MTKTFEQLKSEFSDKCRAASACQGEFRRVLNSETEQQLLKVIYDNLDWCISHEVISHEWLAGFSEELYLKSGIANTGIANTGEENTGFSNSGDRNSGSWNSGSWNSGYRNSGSWNSGDRNSGDSNSGYRNSGDRNSGSWNSGDRNSGDSNSGYRNSGDRNSGSWNSGSWNSGYRNSGSWNSGDRNSGDSNSGYRNSGAFCTDNNPILYLFNKPTTLTVKEWENHKAVQLMINVDPTIWVPANAMTAEEKEKYSDWETTDGYLKSIPIKEAWANAWHNFTDANKKVFTTLPNFDASIFEEITGINVSHDKTAKSK
jgi:hypothetical protein